MIASPVSVMPRDASKPANAPPVVFVAKNGSTFVVGNALTRSALLLSALFLGVFSSLATWADDPDPKGEVTKYVFDQSKIFPGTTREYWIYVPKQYDPAKPADLVAKILASTTDHYLIVGHSNTTPALANLLMKKEVFKQMPDTEYGVFWVIRMKKGVVIKIEVFPY